VLTVELSTNKLPRVAVSAVSFAVVEFEVAVSTPSFATVEFGVAIFSVPFAAVDFALTNMWTGTYSAGGGGFTERDLESIHIVEMSFAMVVV
jgi:hypothetical protein